MTKSLARKMPRLRRHLLDRERDAQYRIVARESAVTTVVDAFVAQVERREHPHRPAKIAPGEEPGLLRQLLELPVVVRLYQPGESPQSRRPRSGQLIENIRKRHRSSFASQAGIAIVRAAAYDCDS